MRLIDRSIKPSRDVYKPPPFEWEDTYPIYLTGDHDGSDSIVVRMGMYRGKVVDFSINQTTLVDGSPLDVARIDCCHGTIHRHQFHRDGTNVRDRAVLCEIPPDSGWEVVDKHYQLCLDLMNDGWQDNLRRWDGDGA
jgi:hypothetical protein